MAKLASAEPNFGNYTIRGIEEIILPPAVSWLPSTFAWKALGMVMLLLLAVVTYRTLRRWKRNQYRRDALAKIRVLRATVRASATVPVQAMSELPGLLKATALKVYPRPEVAALSGKHWLTFLNNSCSGAAFDNTQVSALATLAYKAHSLDKMSVSEAECLLDICERWIRKHKPAADSHSSGASQR